jgi:hypothetical protein
MHKKKINDLPRFHNLKTLHNYIYLFISFLLLLLLLLLFFHNFWALQILPPKNNLVLEINKKTNVNSLVCSLAFYLVLILTDFLFISLTQS